MRTDSTRVSDTALAKSRDFIGTQYGAHYLPEKAIHYRSKKDAQDAHEAIRPIDVSRTPDATGALSRQGRVETVPAHLAAIRRVADDARRVRPNHHRHRGRTLSVPRDGFGLEVRRFPPRLRGRPRREVGRRRRSGAQAAARRTRRESEAQRRHARTAFHRAAATLHRSDARQGARREGHRSAFDLRVDHDDHSATANTSRRTRDVFIRPRSARPSTICSSKVSTTSSTNPTPRGWSASWTRLKKAR